jgi:UDP-GlcNAc:undecaprenyl-phosphate GlcNAc-1-phosphate transferase
MEMSKLMLAAAQAFIVSLFLTPIVRDIFRAYNVVDRPGRRKVHAYPIPRVGGVPIAIACIWAWMSLANPNTEVPRDAIQNLIPGLALIFATGLIDDFFSLKPLIKLLGQIAAALVACGNGIVIDHFWAIPLPPWVSIPLTVFWILLATNALNLIDGLDGLCGGVAFFASMTFFCAGLVAKDAALSMVTLPLAAALIGFLFHNFNPATVFLGDSGALTIGFALGCFGVMWTKDSDTITSTLVPLLALCVPLMDVGLSIVRRTLKAHPIFAADRGHVHHRLLDRGFHVRRAALTLYAISSVAGGFAVLIAYPAARSFHGIVVAGAVPAAWGAIRFLRYPEFIMAGKLLFGGEFRKTLAAKARLDQLSEALAHAATERDWWAHLQRAAREEAWHRVVWTNGPEVRECVLSYALAEWTLTVAIDEVESVRIEGSAVSDNPLDLSGLSRSIRLSRAAARPVNAQVAIP